jgi:hypothetical protein
MLIRVLMLSSKLWRKTRKTDRRTFLTGDRNLPILKFSLLAFAMTSLAIVPSYAGPPYRTDDPEPVASNHL